MFVQPRVDLEALKPPPRADLVGCRSAGTGARARAEAAESAAVLARELGRAGRGDAAGAGARPGNTGEAGHAAAAPEPQEQIAQTLPPADTGARRSPTTSRPAPGALGDALRNLERYVQNETFNNPQGGLTDPGATIQFDTKGVEFGPWLRRFIAQVRRNWFVPYAAMTFRGRVVLQFNIHKDGRITDISVVGAIRHQRLQPRGEQRHPGLEPDRAAAAGVPGAEGVLHRHLLLQREPAGELRRGTRVPTRSQQFGLIILLVALTVYVFVKLA